MVTPTGETGWCFVAAPGDFEPLREVAEGVVAEVVPLAAGTFDTCIRAKCFEMSACLGSTILLAVGDEGDDGRTALTGAVD